ncbi:MAG: epoxyqueuosine reductase QueH [Candidatus Woesearchaeota archaeon]|nr:epoxyqueuosine reductase QueH [Candidatus Woesearchaeota archaeon]
MKKLLLHICCAPCSTHAIEFLKSKYDLVLFFPNSNICPEGEFKKRSENAKKITGIFNLKLIIDNYCHEEWLEFVKGLEDEPEKGKRCWKCFEFNLRKTAEKARELGFDCFTTTLTISPHKDSKKIFEIGKKLETGGIRFLDIDFKKQEGFRHSVELSKKYDLYRQNYCGCEFSLRSSIASPKLKNL